MLSDIVNRLQQAYPECISFALCLVVPSFFYMCAIRIFSRLLLPNLYRNDGNEPHVHMYMFIHVLLSLLGSQILYLLFMRETEWRQREKTFAASDGPNRYFSEGKFPTVIIHSMSYHAIGSYPLYFLRHWILALFRTTESFLRRLLLGGDVRNFLKVRTLFFFHLHLFLVKFRIFHSFPLTFLAFLS